MIRKNLIIYCIVLIFMSFPVMAEAGSDLVIVTSNDSKITPLSRKELRRVYLGLKVVRNDDRVKPIRNYSNEVLHEVFLQKIMFMSSRTYERQLNVRTIRKGLKPPEKFTSHQAVVKALVGNTNSIAYMWKNQVSNSPEIRILQTQ